MTHSEGEETLPETFPTGAPEMESAVHPPRQPQHHQQHNHLYHCSCSGSSTKTDFLFQYGLLQLLIKKLFLVLLISGKSALDWLLYLAFSRALGSSLLLVFRCRMKAAFAGDMLNRSRLPLLMLRGERRARFLELPSSLCPPCHGHSARLRNRH